MNAHPTFPTLPGVLRRCSPVIVHDDGTRPHGPPEAPADYRGVIVSDHISDTSTDPETGVVHPVGGWLVALFDGTEPASGQTRSRRGRSRSTSPIQRGRSIFGIGWQGFF